MAVQIEPTVNRKKNLKKKKKKGAIKKNLTFLGYVTR